MVSVMLLGGTGCLGSQLVDSLRSKRIPFTSPTHKQCDIKDSNALEEHIKLEEPSIIIHSAGYVNTEAAEFNIDECIETNVIGTYNVVKLCRKYNIRLVGISSEYVFYGRKDKKYYPDSGLDPKNVYGLTKGCFEFLIKTLTDYLIVRAPFIRSTTFPYDAAFLDQYTCRSYVDEISDQIVNFSISSDIGVKHIISKYQNVFELAKVKKPEVLGIRMPEALKAIIPMYLNLLEE
tara:strand:+ start:2459 stop:3160 length:702 start_codon:yes stop_codon:yes gene_type:complete